MLAFKEMDIAPPAKGMEGEKIKVQYVLNIEIEVHRFEIKPSKQNAGEDCLYLQIVHKQEKRVLFTGSKYLMDMIKKIKPDNFPFKTTIIKQDEHFEFT